MAVYKVAITGGIGSGKSTVAKLIAARGYSVLSCDEIARELPEEPSVKAEIVRAFGEDVYGETLNRGKLASLVFQNPAALERLNAILHRGVFRRLEEAFAECREKVLFVEIPLLFETGSESRFDKIVVVMREREARILSVMERSGLSREEVTLRMKSQFDYEKLAKNEHTVIYNDSDLSELERKVTELLYEIEKEIH